MIPRLHLVTDDRILEGSGFLARALAVFEAGGDRILMHLRGPRSSGRRIWELGRALLPAARDRGVPLVLNDRVDVALALGAAGVHLGARSFTVGEARTLLERSPARPGRRVGRSVRATASARELIAETSGGVDFVLAGTIFPTPTHPEHPGAGAGALRAVTEALPAVPVLGIGGVEAGRVAEVMAAGAHGVAVLRAVWDAADPAGAVDTLLGRVDAGREAARRGRSV